MVSRGNGYLCRWGSGHDEGDSLMEIRLIIWFWALVGISRMQEAVRGMPELA